MNLHVPAARGLALAVILLAGCQPTAQTGADAAPAPVAGEAPAVPQAPVAVDASEGVAGYVARASALLEALRPGADVPALRRDAEALMELGAALVPDFVERHPHCREYLDAALRVRTAWPTLDLEAIERDYHHDGILPKVENSGVCYHMKDLVTHPATVLVLLRSEAPDYAKARAEIEEVVQHAGFVDRSTQAQ